MRNVAFPIACLSVVVMAACAPRVVPLPVVTSPRFPDFIAPAVPAALSGTPAAAQHERAWVFLQAGDLRNAEREFSTALQAEPGFYPAEIGLGYLDLADRDSRGALEHFDRALARQPAEPSALVGRGEAHLALDNQDEALAAFEAAVAVDSSLTQIGRRVEVLKFRVAGQRLADARAAAGAGRIDDAIRAYTLAIESSPDSAFLYRELAGVERQRGDAAAALAHLHTAVDLDPADAGSLAGIGELLEVQGDFEGAAKAYGEALAIEPGADLQARIEAVRARAELARLPAEYRAIGEAPQITRGELAALIGVRLAPLLQDHRIETEPITDARTDWAAMWILAVTRAGVMEPFANHAFQPRTPVRRVDLAQAVERLLRRVAALKPGPRAAAWESARVQFVDLAPAHLAYPAASAAVASGVLTAGPGGTFAPSGIVSGREATEAIERLEALAGLPLVRHNAAMTVFTPANQLTLLRMLMIPAFVILVVYGELGWALGVFVTAGITDGLDGLIARRSGKTTLGAWLDPMADKLLLVTTFVVLTWPGLGLANRFPIWLTVCIISRDLVIVLTVVIVNLAIGRRTFRPSILGKIATATYMVTAVVAMVFNYLGYHSSLFDVLVWASLAITLVSAFHYIGHAARIIETPQQTAPV